jgi:DNA-directed RNA polymerase III subunit RPC6
MVLDMLVFDNKVEKIPLPAEPLMLHEGHDDDDLDDVDESSDAFMYRLVREKLSPSGFAQMPCGICPVRNDCTEFGSINPQNCEYLGNWLDF